LRKGKPPNGSKCARVAYLFRYREVSWQANACYLDALAVVDDSTNCTV
jgi:hypothetical protein